MKVEVELFKVLNETFVTPQLKSLLELPLVSVHAEIAPLVTLMYPVFVVDVVPCGFVISKVTLYDPAALKVIVGF